MDPCPFIRIVIGNLALRLLPEKEKSFVGGCHYYCKFKLKGFNTQVSEISVLNSENDAVESRIHGCFTFNKSEIDKLGADNKSGKLSCLRIEVYRRLNNSCGFLKSDKLLGRIVLQLDFKSVLENNHGRGCLVQNGWILISGSESKLHLNVRAEPDPRFVFQFDGEPECSPQVFQVNGNVKQSVFTCKFTFRNSGERNLRSRSSLSEPSTSTSCFASSSDEHAPPLIERKGWSITIHDLSGSPVAAASMVTPFVPSPGTDRVSKSNPGAWLILRPGNNTWKPWGRLEAWREKNGIGHKFDLIPDGGIDSIPLANSRIGTKTGGKFSIDVTNGPTPMTSPNSSFDLGSGSGSGSGSELGSASGSGSWANFLYRGFVMSSTVEGDGKCSRPLVEVGAQHVQCTEDAAVFVALAAAMDLSMDACRLFSQKLRKELRQPDLNS